jgi:hypothetical protein
MVVDGTVPSSSGYTESGLDGARVDVGTHDARLSDKLRCELLRDSAGQLTVASAFESAPRKRFGFSET